MINSLNYSDEDFLRLNAPSTPMEIELARRLELAIETAASFEELVDALELDDCDTPAEVRDAVVEGWNKAQSRLTVVEDENEQLQEEIENLKIELKDVQDELRACQ